MSARMVSSSLNAMHEIRKPESREQNQDRTNRADREANKGKHSIQEGYWYCDDGQSASWVYVCRDTDH